MKFWQLNFNPTKKTWWFTLRSANGRVLMTSETYKTRRGADRAMATAQATAAVALGEAP